MEMIQDDYYSTIPDPENNEYCSPAPPLPERKDDEYSTLGPAEPAPLPDRKDEYSTIDPAEPAADNSPYYLELKGDDDC